MIKTIIKHGATGNLFRKGDPVQYPNGFELDGGTYTNWKI